MNKNILFVALFLMTFAWVESTGCIRECKKNVPSRSVCVADSKRNICRKVRECRMKEENCLLKSKGRKPMRETNMLRCRNILGHAGKASCSRITKKRSAPLCGRSCKDDNIPLCHRSRDNRCRLLTQCQGKRANCHRSKQNKLTVAARAQCSGMKPGQKARKCRIVKKG